MSTGSVFADTWNDKTTMTFSEPVMVPGATLQPGSYVFRLMDFKANRHTVRIMNEDESRVIAIANAIPVKRLENEGTTTLTFGATESGAPPALKAWYYPGTTYGHEFIYSDEEARQIAAREKTLVLSEDAAQSADSAGALRIYDADGNIREWKADEAVIREWRDWTSARGAEARSVTETSADEERRESSAPMMAIDQTAMRVEVDDLEDDAHRYAGKTIMVSGEVEKVLGPRLFTIDEPHWADLDGEVLVHMPTALATLVRPDDLVTITGTIRPFVEAELQEEWSWFSDDDDVTVHFAERPVLVATRVAGGDSDRALFIARPADDRTAQSENTRTAMPSDESSRTDSTPVSAIDEVTSATVGRTVELSSVQVEQVIPGRGFLVATDDGTSVFVRRADAHAPGVEKGASVSIDGFVLTMPPAMRDHFRGMTEPDADVYVYATEVS